MYLGHPIRSGDGRGVGGLGGPLAIVVGPVRGGHPAGPLGPHGRFAFWPGESGVRTGVNGGIGFR